MKIPYRQPWFIITIILLLAGVAVWWFFFRTTETVVTTSTTTVERGTIVESVSGSGSVIAKISSDVTTSGASRIEKIYVENGETVTADQTLVALKSLSTDEELAQAYASLLSAQKAVTSAEQTLTESQKNEQIKQTNLEASQLAYDQAKIAVNKSIIDADKGVISAAMTQESADTDLETVSAERTTESAEIELKTAKLSGQESLKTAEASLAQAKLNAESAATTTKISQQSLTAAQASLTATRLSYQAMISETVTAPVAGTVMNMSLVEGSVVGKNDSSDGDSDDSSSSSTLFSIVDMTSLRAQVSISEVDISSIALGQPATLTFDALSDKTATGVISNIDTLSTTTSGVTTYNVEITFDQLDETIRPGMSVDASIITVQKNDVLLIPTNAVQYQDDQASVTVMRDGVATTVEVTVGASDDLNIEITDGLSEGDEVVISGSNITGSFSDSESDESSQRSGSGSMSGMGSVMGGGGPPGGGF